jgi:DNA polymerase III alpha subunit (gram-positive type)
MNLVFFDIECASVFKNSAKICAFGYVVCNEQFEILEKKDILINPKGKFHLTDRKGEKGLVLPYAYDEFLTQPVFSEVYPFIKQLLEDKNNIVVGHSTMNDIKYLDLETNRYKLPPFHFEFSDTQLIYMTMNGSFTRQFGLEFISEDLQVEFTPHRAVDDAYATMKICEAMCKQAGCSFVELEAKYGIIHGKLSNHRVKKPTSVAFEHYSAMAHAAKEERAKVREEFYRYVNCRRCKKGGELKGKIFNFSREIEDNLTLSKPLVAAVYEKGGTYSSHISACNVYVAEESDKSVRTENARKMAGLEILSIEEAKEILYG